MKLAVVFQRSLMVLRLLNISSQRTQAWIDLILYFIFFFPGVVALAFYGYEYAALAWKIKETSWSSPAQIQIYMVKSMIPAAPQSAAEPKIYTYRGLSKLLLAEATLLTGTRRRQNSD